MNRPGLRRAVAVLAAVAAVLGLSGCFKVNHDMSIRADGTGSVVLHVEVNKKAVEAITRSFGGGLGAVLPPMEEPFKPVDKTFPDGTKVTAVNNADRSTLDASFDFSGPDDYNRKMAQVGEAVSPDADGGVTSDAAIQVSRVGDRMEVSLDVGDATDGTEAYDPALLQGVLDPDAMPSVLFTVTMPGAIVATNGEQNGRTVTWDLLSRTAPSNLTVTSKIEKEGLPAWALPAGGGLILAMLLAILAVLLTQRRRKAQPAGPPPPIYQPGPWPPAGAAPGGPTFFPPAPGPPPQEPAGWPPVPPPGGSVPPQPPGEPVRPANGPERWPSSPGPDPVPGLPPRESSGWAPQETVAWSPQAPAAPGAAAPRAPSPPEPPPAPPPPPEPPPPPASAPEPAAAADPLPWRVPGSGEPATAPNVEPQPEPTAAVPVTPSVEPGWYADPAGGSGARYWDGRQWTEHTT